MQYNGKSLILRKAGKFFFPEIKLQEETFSFALQNTDLTVDGASFACKSLTSEAVKAALGSYYRDGTLNWTYAGCSDRAIGLFGGTSGSTTYKWDGLRMYCKDAAGDLLTKYFIAFRIKAEYSGRYKFSLAHNTSRYGAVGSVYIADGGKDVSYYTMENLASKATYLGKVNYYEYVPYSDYYVNDTYMENTYFLEAGKDYYIFLTADKAEENTAYLFPIALYIESP